jgi:hypothetical protein
VKKPRPKKLPNPQPSEGDVVVWDDPEWRPALDAIDGYQPDGTYTGKPNLKPLAKLLRSGKPVPDAVAVTLGGLLDPPWGKKGPRLVLSESARYSAARNSAYVKEMVKLQRLIEAQLRQTPKLEAAIAAVAQNTKIKRSKLMKARSWNLDKSIIRLGTYNPHSYLSPREPGKS